MDSKPTTPDQLPRRLGVFSAAAVVVGAIIGSGIFGVTAEIANGVGTVGAMALAWLTGGLITLCLAWSMAELSAMFPSAGGTYVYLREAFGPMMAFLFGWIFLLFAPAGWAGIAAIFSRYAAPMLGVDHAHEYLITIAVIGVVTVTNALSVTFSSRVQSATTIAKALALFGLALALFLLAKGSDGALAAPIDWHPTSLAGFGTVLVAVLWAYDGVGPFCALSGEVKDPGRSLPIALLVGVTIVVVLYMLINAAYLYALPLDAVKASTLVAGDAAESIGGNTARQAISVLVMVSTFGAVSALGLTDPRVFFAMGRDGLFFRSIGAIHPRFATPARAVVLSGLIACLYASRQEFEQLAATFVLGLWPFYALAVAGVIILRRKRPDQPRPYRTFGYPVVPAAFVAATFLILGNALVTSPVSTGMNIGLTLLGIPVYFIWKRVTR
jgi:APA family basic amino acid/polyamine antiporter